MLVAGRRCRIQSVTGRLLQLICVESRPNIAACMEDAHDQDAIRFLTIEDEMAAHRQYPQRPAGKGPERRRLWLTSGTLDRGLHLGQIGFRLRASPHVDAV